MKDARLELDMYQFCPKDEEPPEQVRAVVKPIGDYPVPGRPYALEILPVDGPPWVILMNSLEARALRRAFEEIFDDE